MRVIGWRNPASRREIEYKQLTNNFSCGQPGRAAPRLEQEHTWRGHSTGGSDSRRVASDRGPCGVSSRFQPSRGPSLPRL
jgi:hypothetical protein